MASFWEQRPSPTAKFVIGSSAVSVLRKLQAEDEYIPRRQVAALKRVLRSLKEMTCLQILHYSLFPPRDRIYHLGIGATKLQKFTDLKFKTQWES